MLEQPRFRENPWSTFLGWFLLTFIAGAVNAGGFLACNRFVTHVTGFATLFGVETSILGWAHGLSMLSVPVFFLMGAMIAAYFGEYQMRYGRQPNYDIILLLEFVCLLLAAIGGHLGYFGNFGHDLSLKRDYLLLALLCFSMGLQNATVTSSSGAVVRTTHLTGITTDLGIGFIRCFAFFKDGQRGGSDYLREIWANGFRLGIVASFSAGAAIGALMFIYYGYLGFLMPALLVLLALALVRRHQLRKRSAPAH